MHTHIKYFQTFLNDNQILSSVVGSDPETILDYSRDRSRKVSPSCDLILLPASNDELKKIVSYCYLNNVKVVPSGGRTGLAGGAIATKNEIVISMSKMNKLLSFDPVSASVTVEAGMITQVLSEYVKEQGLFFPIHFAASGSSHIAGNVASNAGGLQVVRYGNTRSWVLGLKLINGKAEEMDLGGNILKDNTGYNLMQLVIASEGTLGIISELTLRLTSLPAETSVLLLAVPNFSSVLEIFSLTHRSGLTLNAFEFFSDICLTEVLSESDLSNPFELDYPYYLVLEFEADKEDEKLFQFFESLMERALIDDGTVAQSSTQAVNIWKYRELISESLSLSHLVHKNDISIPLSNMNAFFDEFENSIKHIYPDFIIALFGHVGDGNIHINILKPDKMSEEDFFSKADKADLKVFALVKKYKGSISAEHGIGLLKKKGLATSKSSYELEIQKGIKNLFDPKNIMNPGKIFD